MAVSLSKPGFAFSEVVEILATMFGVHPDRRETFVSRLQQLQKMGLPGGVNVGRGSKVRYVNWQVAELALMLDLLNCGITPGMLKEYFVPSGRNFVGVYSTGGYDWHIQNSLVESEKDLFFLLRFNALAYLKNPKSSDAKEAANPFDREDFGRSSENVLGELDQGPALAINMTAHLRRLRAAVEGVYPDRMEDITFYPTRSGQKEG